jgi:hypothetical protein
VAIQATRIPLTHCPHCKGPIVYEKQRTGLAWLHELANGDLEFLCPDPIVLVKPVR